MRLNAQPRHVVHGHDHRQRARRRHRTGSGVQQLRTAARRERRQQHLVPQHAPVEAPRIERGKLQRTHVGAGRGQCAREIALIHPDARRRADGELRVEGDPHPLQRAIAARISAG